MTNSLRDTIREATRQSHARLDAAMNQVDLGRRRNYADFLRGQAEALFPLEAALEENGISELLPDWEQRRRSPALEHDLAALDTGVDPLPMPVLNRGGNDCSPEMLGIMYVLEGSRMGARVILARIAEAPDSEILGATAFLRHGFGRRFWPTFLDRLEHNLPARANPARAIAGAQLAFGMFECALMPSMNVTSKRAVGAGQFETA
jgi:heme oxygenase (biliverdin-IX-beta and delta-forming)